MVYLSSVNNEGLRFERNLSFGKREQAKPKEQQQEESAKLLYKEKRDHPFSTAFKIQKDKLKHAFYDYPKKGFEGSKNANFYEFLTMGTVPYLIGSASMIAVFNAASSFYDEKAAENASKLGKKMALGVIFYGLAKNLSRKLVEEPVKYKYGIDINVPYRLKIDEIPEERNVDVLHNEKKEKISPDTESEKDKNGNLVAYEIHKAFESVDFPRWDLFYDNKDFGDERNSYFTEVGKRMGYDDKDIEHSDQRVKPLIKEKIVQTNAFATLSSYFWAATGVCVAMQKPWEDLSVSPIRRYKNWKNGFENPPLIKEFVEKFAKSCKEFIGSDRNGPIDYIVNKCKHQTPNTLKTPELKHIAGRTVFGLAAGLTLLGNFLTLTDFNKGRGKNSSASSAIFDDSKEKVVC